MSGTCNNGLLHYGLNETRHRRWVQKSNTTIIAHTYATIRCLCVRQLPIHVLVAPPFLEILNDDRCENSDAEVRILTASPARAVEVRNITGRGRTPAMNVPTSRRENPLTYPAASHPSTGGVPRWNKY
ncbi:hypothetical protein AVEN_60685-1 [Araneus ventricosus]|uniref:Uncharacterized protein n=1 Tax=Araneus ventricosus TaxID=182803 RepID=A0A4Y2MAN8_ARAVE|nr:hypothetical protein AVEN_60685-1 [Araneus ventricosus]